ncbi:hypothetical protein BDP27DRAFT_1372685 [Rhodocollybia butyracea]|uniref:Uncharacterized protein n=1 Tax=Rhodocollybia butyracea TaxID=206335 RepID=A0A9P5P9T1_9AGAR|nr:hypothetical protein BDP27DRAFT_1372685 [Rhodocollybia butyracea]
MPHPTPLGMSTSTRCCDVECSVIKKADKGRVKIILFGPGIRYSWTISCAKESFSSSSLFPHLPQGYLKAQFQQGATYQLSMVVDGGDGAACSIMVLLYSELPLRQLTYIKSPLYTITTTDMRYKDRKSIVLVSMTGPYATEIWMFEWTVGKDRKPRVYIVQNLDLKPPQV